MIKKIFTSAAVWTTLGLASGLFYREFTRQRDYTGFTQLAVAHTHALALGTTILLITMGLTKVFALDTDRRMRLFLLFWNIGLGLTFTMMLIKGSLQVLGAEIADSAMIAGISGLGHMILTGAFVLFFLILRRAVKAESVVEQVAQPVG